MVDKTQMPHLLALLDDRSEKVRSSVKAALESFGADLDPALDAAGASQEQRKAVQELISESPDSPLFVVGQLVRHKRYGYRGVVVAVDDQCGAGDDWYQGNKTQPDRDQPWYHVFADGSDQVFYPAQTSLEADPDAEPIDHPLLAEFFEGFTGDGYRRNDRPWQL